MFMIGDFVVSKYTESATRYIIKSIKASRKAFEKTPSILLALGLFFYQAYLSKIQVYIALTAIETPIQLVVIMDK